MKRLLSALLVLALLLTGSVTALAAPEDTIRAAFEATGDYMASLGDPSAGSTGGEWMVLGFARSGREVPDSYYDSVAAYVEENIDANNRLHETKATVNCRFILALTAIGRDPTNVGGHDLLAGLNDMGYIRKVGVSGVIWTLLAFDCGNYETPPGVDREELVDALLSLRTPQGGWANSGNIPDPDVTAMAIQALAPYRDSDPEVSTALDAAVAILADTMDETGNFPGQYGSSSETVSQVIVALTTLGIDPNTDERFVRNGVSALDGLLGYYVEGGGFRHIASGKLDGIATEQGYYALAAYHRLLEGKTALYDMTDGPCTQSQEAPEAMPEARVPENLWLWAVLGCGAVLMLLCLAMRKRLGKRKFSNAMMVIIIALIAALGIGFVIQTGVLNREPAWGSEYRITPIPDNRLVTNADTENLCTITIRCDTILRNPDLLDEAKAPYVPGDGVILPEITVEFTPGETVFDVLLRVCQAAEIPLEYSWTPLYDSYYLEGINHIYEYDCGAESGWIYRISGVSPNSGSSSCEVKPGDKIQWLYTCIGLGADLTED